MKKIFSLVLFLAASISFVYANEKSAESDCFSKVLNKRYSGYVFDPARAIPTDIIVNLAEAARLAPSCYNEQPWHFIFVDKMGTPEAYQKTLGCLAEGNQKWAQNAPLLIVAAAHTKFTKNQAQNRWGSYDTGAAAVTLVLKAASLGLMAHEMGGFDEERLKQELAIPLDYEPYAVIAVGYTDFHPAKIKDRKPLGSNFFWGEWGVGLTVEQSKIVH